MLSQRPITQQGVVSNDAFSTFHLSFSLHFSPDNSMNTSQDETDSHTHICRLILRTLGCTSNIYKNINRHKKKSHSTHFSGENSGHISTKTHSASCPPFIQWIKDVMKGLQIEKLRFTLNGSLQKYNTIWFPFIDYVEHFQHLCC